MVLDQIREVVLAHRGAVCAPHIEHVLVLDALWLVHPSRLVSPRQLVEGHPCNVAQSAQCVLGDVTQRSRAPRNMSSLAGEAMALKMSI